MYTVLKVAINCFANLSERYLHFCGTIYSLCTTSLQVKCMLIESSCSKDLQTSVLCSKKFPCLNVIICFENLSKRYLNFCGTLLISFPDFSAGKMYADRKLFFQRFADWLFMFLKCPWLKVIICFANLSKRYLYFCGTH